VDCALLRDAATAAGVINAVTYNYRGNPLVQEARTRIARGDLGPVVNIEGQYLQDWMTDENVYSWRMDPVKGGVSSALADIGSHWCDLAEHISGARITSVLADMHNVVATRYFSGHSSEAFGKSSSGNRIPVAIMVKISQIFSCASIMAHVARCAWAKCSQATRTIFKSNSTAVKDPSVGSRSAKTSSGLVSTIGLTASFLKIHRSLPLKPPPMPIFPPATGKLGGCLPQCHRGHIRLRPRPQHETRDTVHLRRCVPLLDHHRRYAAERQSRQSLDRNRLVARSLTHDPTDQSPTWRHDVPRVLHLGCLVRHRRHVALNHLPLQRPAGRPCRRVNGRRRYRRPISSLFPKEAIQLLRERSMATFAIASFLICIPLQFYYAFTNLFLNNTGIHNAAGKMTGGQMSELFCMLLIPWFFRRLGVKYMLAAGMAAWVLRYLLFAFGNPSTGVWMFWVGILLHGICYDFFFVTGQIYIDRKSSLALRSAAQGMITFITYGLGMFVGSWLSGAVVDHYTTRAADGVRSTTGAASGSLPRQHPLWSSSPFSSPSTNVSPGQARAISSVNLKVRPSSVRFLP